MASFMFTLSNKFKQAANQEADKRHISTALLMREALAAYIGYDTSHEVEGRTRKGKYESPEAKKAARKERNRQKRQEEKELLTALKQGLKASELAAIRATIRNPDKE